MSHHGESPLHSDVEMSQEFNVSERLREGVPRGLSFGLQGGRFAASATEIRPSVAPCSNLPLTTNRIALRMLSHHGREAASGTCLECD